MHSTMRQFYDAHPYPWYPPGLGYRLPDDFLRRLGRDLGLSLPEKLEVLAAGCGTVAPRALALAHPRARITALDLSVETLGRARRLAGRHLERRIHWQQGDIADPTLVARLGEGRFHVVHATGVLMLADSPALALKNLRRLLAPGGFVRFLVYSRGGRLLIDLTRTAIRSAGLRGYRDLKLWLDSLPVDHPFRFILASYTEAWCETGLQDGFFVPDHYLGSLADWQELFAAADLTLARLDQAPRAEAAREWLPMALHTRYEALLLAEKVALLEGIGEWRTELTGLLVPQTEGGFSGTEERLPQTAESIPPDISCWPAHRSLPRALIWREMHGALRRGLPDLRADEFSALLASLSERQWPGGLRGLYQRWRFSAWNDGARRCLDLAQVISERFDSCLAELAEELPPLPRPQQWPDRQWRQGFAAWQI